MQGHQSSIERTNLHLLVHYSYRRNYCTLLSLPPFQSEDHRFHRGRGSKHKEQHNRLLQLLSNLGLYTRMFYTPHRILKAILCMGKAHQRVPPYTHTLILRQYCHHNHYRNHHIFLFVLDHMLNSIVGLNPHRYCHHNHYQHCRRTLAVKIHTHRKRLIVLHQCVRHNRCLRHHKLPLHINLHNQCIVFVPYYIFYLEYPETHPLLYILRSL